MTKSDIDYSKTYSPYRLNMFNECPQKYYLTYIDPRYRSYKYELRRKPENIFKEMVIGSIVHDAITLFYHQPKNKRSKENLLKGLKRVWRNFDIFPKYNKLPLGRRGGFESIEEERQEYRNVQGMLENFYEMRNPNWEIFYLPTDDFENSIEDFNNSVVPLTEEYNIGGKLDLIVKMGDDLHVIDFKTGSNQSEDEFQLLFYKLLTELNFDKPVQKASFYNVKQKNITEKTLEDTENTEVKEEILKRIREIINTEDFPCNSSGLCNYCIFRNVCAENDKEDKNIPF